MKRKPARIFLVAFFRFDDRGAEYCFERCHLQTFYITLRDAKKSIDYFCDEAGWYEGVLIEEREEGTPHFHGRRWFYIMIPNTNGEMREIPEPESFKNICNLIS